MKTTYTAVFLLLSLFCTPISVDEMVGDFAPLSVSNEWVYSAAYTNIIQGIGTFHSTTLTLTITDSTIVNGTTQYSATIRDSGIVIVINMPLLFSDTSSFDTTSHYTFSKTGDTFTNPPCFNSETIPFFLVNRVKATHTLKIQSIVEYTDTIGGASVVYRADRGLTYLNKSIIQVSTGLYGVNNLTIVLQLQSFNGTEIEPGMHLANN